ncbi:hypothetical protein ACIBCO_33595 [Streptomyces violascens]|uniref:hypothetical protein n=1 Tax=Streptomyces violascens TaxID=67381 RepID=UPI0037AECC25
MNADQDLRSTVDALLDGLRADLEQPARIPSIAFPGAPTLTTGLRGASEVTVEVRTLAEARHSGEFGGAAPDAILVLLHALATLHDADGIDAPSVDHAASALVPYARAKPDLRFHPQEARGALVAHLGALRPFGIPLTVTQGDAGPGFEPATGGPAYRAALTELRGAVIAEAAFLRECATAFGGES